MKKDIKLFSILTVFIHIAIWMLVIQLQYDLSGLWGSFNTLLDGVRFVDEAFIAIPTLVVLFYWNSHFLVPNYLSQQSWWKYVLGLLISFLVLFHLGYFIIDILLEKGYESGFDESIHFYDHSLPLHLIVVGISTSLGISNIAMKTAKQKEQAEKMQKEAEMKYLNAQINPHFLYNTLNGIYAQALEDKAEKTTELILQLSEIMRYPLNNISKESIPLTDEVAFIKNFITLQRLRLGEEYPITFNKTGDFSPIKIIPFIIIPLVENAFKYGVSQKNQSPISFHLEIKENELFFLSKNKKITATETKSHLVGIRNLRARLHLKYGKRYSLNITETDRDYTAELRVKQVDN